MIISPPTVNNQSITIRQTEYHDAPFLPAIEQSAGQLFRKINDLSWIAESDVQDIQSHLAFIDKHAHWVAVNNENQPVGFIMTRDLPDSLFIHELSVSEAWQNKGIGKQLIQQVIAQAKYYQFPAVTLTTFRHVPWNAAYYQRIGFIYLADDNLPVSLQKILQREVTDAGFDRATRCAMQLTLSH